MTSSDVIFICYDVSMKELGTIIAKDFDPNGSGVFNDAFGIREAARAVLLTDSGEVYLMNVRLHGYHKLPGGGIDEGESKEQALVRELLEEVGCRAEIISELGLVNEYRTTPWRGSERIKQISYCYLAKQIGEQVASELEEGEIAEQMIEVKAKSIQHAIELLSADTPDNIEGEFIRKRDLYFLRAAQQLQAHTN